MRSAILLAALVALAASSGCAMNRRHSRCGPTACGHCQSDPCQCGGGGCGQAYGDHGACRQGLFAGMHRGCDDAGCYGQGGGTRHCGLFERMWLGGRTHGMRDPAHGTGVGMGDRGMNGSDMAGRGMGGGMAGGGMGCGPDGGAGGMMGGGLGRGMGGGLYGAELQPAPGPSPAMVATT